jgi:hypothetical protein
MGACYAKRVDDGSSTDGVPTIVRVGACIVRIVVGVVVNFFHACQDFTQGFNTAAIVVRIVGRVARNAPWIFTVAARIAGGVFSVARWLVATI